MMMILIIVVVIRERQQNEMADELLHDEHPPSFRGASN